MPNPSRALRLKRALDVVVSSCALTALSPGLLALLGVVTVAHGWPPIFIQRRPGLHGAVFSMIKLRTMTNERGPDGQLLPDERRLTQLGAALRALSLDELPELVNVLSGTMSLVGPRPLLVSYLPLYSREQARRHEMPPGITGWAQVNGRNALSWEEKFRFDVEYVNSWSLRLDLEILARTVASVVRREGISASGSATMPVFEGSIA